MKKIIFILICLFSLVSCGNLSIITNNNGEQIDITQISEKGLGETLSPAIVGVYSSSNNVGNIGAGVCVNNQGYIITNSHVISDASSLTLYLYDGNTCSANLVYEDTVLDFAILKSNIALPYLPLSDEDLQVGDNVIAVGTPISLMLKHTYTKGIVSAINRTIKINTENGESYMQNLIQHDASLNPGNSGGPLINTSGEVVGINTLKITSGEGIGFAIPVKSFRTILENVVNKVSLQTPYLGIYGYDAEIAKFNKLTNLKSGFYVESINADSPASKILNNGDIIISINNEYIKNASDLRYELYKYNANDTINLEYISNGKTYQKQIKLHKRLIYT